MKVRLTDFSRSIQSKPRIYLLVMLCISLPGFLLWGCVKKIPMIRFDLDQLTELPPIHNIHRGKKMTPEMNPTPQTLECHLCHGEDVAKKKQIPSMFTCLDCHTGQLAPKLPCTRCHMGTKKIFAGVGAAETGEKPSPMAEFDCTDCHELENKLNVPQEVCFDCHEEEELKPKSQLQKEFVEKLANVESYYKQIKNYIKPSHAKGKSLINMDEFKRGEYIYKFASLDRSKGVHNSGFVIQLLSEADKTLSRLSRHYDDYITRLTQETKSDDPKMRRKAIRMLGEIGDEKVQDILIQIMQNPDPALHTLAMQMLGKIGGEKARNALIQNLQNPNAEIRLKSAKSLGKIKGEKTLDALIQTLQDKDYRVREVVVTILGEIKGQKTTKALTKTLNDPDFRVQYRAKTALEKLKATYRSTKGSKTKNHDFFQKWTQ